MNEIWRSVRGHEDIYEVSDTGKVRSLDREVMLPDGRKRRIRGKILKPKRNADNYLFVSLSRDGFTNTRYIHRLVATAFIHNPDGLPEVNHLNGNKQDNTPGNLAWCTHQQNVIHAYDNGLSRNTGSSHKFAVGVIDNQLGRSYETIRDWSIARGINYSTGRNILSGCNKSKVIDLSEIVLVRQTKDKSNE